MRNLIAKRPWLVAMSGMTVALMAVAFLAAASFSGPAQAAESKVGGMTLADDAFLIGGMAETEGAAVYHTIMSGVIQTSQFEDLVMDVSLECGLVTDTKVRSKGGTKVSSTAQAGVMVRLLIDAGTDNEHYAMPGRGVDYSGGIVFCKRLQEQTASFGGVLDECTDLNGDDLITILECTWEEEELQLVLDTMGAHSFNFFDLDYDQGVHTIDVQVKLWANADFQNVDPDYVNKTIASIGYGSVAIDEVKFVKGYNP